MRRRRDQQVSSARDVGPMTAAVLASNLWVAIGVIAGVLLFAGGLAAMITLISHSPAAVQGPPSSPG